MVKKNTVKFAHLRNVLPYCFGVLFHTNAVPKKTRFGDKQPKNFKMCRINCCLAILKGKLELSGADDNFKAIRGKKGVIHCFPSKKLSA